MRRLLKYLSVFFILLIAFSYPISWFISKHFYTYTKQNWILNLNDYQLDYAVLGSSRVFNMVDIKTLDSSWQKKGINLGTSGSCYAENYLILSEFLKRNKVSKLLLNIDEFSFNSQNSYSYPFHDFEFLTLTNRYDSVFYDFIPAWKFYLWKTIPMAKYCEFNDNFTLKKHVDPELDKNMGTSLVDEAEEEEKNKKDQLQSKRRQDEKNELDEKYFFKTLDLCKKNKIEVVLITTPIYSNKKSKSKNFSSEYIISHPALAGLKFLDFNDLIDYSNHNYFVDYTHTNSLGSITYSDSLGKKLKELNL